MSYHHDNYRRVGNMKHNHKDDFGGKNGAKSANHFLRKRLRRAERRSNRQQEREGEV